jgi:prepilin-type N-terminal cleavage/methylation domain-containing protein
MSMAGARTASGGARSAGEDRMNLMRKSRAGGYTLIELVVVMGAIAILMLVALPSLTKFGNEQRFRLAARQFKTAFRAARQEAMTRQTQVLFTIDDIKDPKTDQYSVYSYLYYYKPDLIDGKSLDGGVTYPYRGKNYSYALGDKAGDLDGTKRPAAVHVSTLPQGITVTAFPGQAGHQSGTYNFVYPDMTGQYKATGDKILLWNGGADTTIVNVKDSLIPASPTLFKYWVDIGANGSVNDGYMSDQIVVSFQDTFIGDQIDCTIDKSTGNITDQEK